MRKLLVALLFAVLLPFSCARAQDPGVGLLNRHPDGVSWLRLEPGACKNAKILALVPPAERKQLRAGTASIEGKLLPVCWVPMPGGYAWAFEDGEAGALPAEAFVKVSGA